MKQYLLKISGLVAIALVLHPAVFSQDLKDDTGKERITNEKSDKLDDGDAIVIKRKSDKDVKITVEVKGDKVFVNGKLYSEYEDGDVSVKKLRAPFFDPEAMTMIAPKSPFRGGWNYSVDGDFTNTENAKTAFLGVSAENADNG